MVAIVGLLVVIGAIIGGYLMEHGNLKVLMQPAELLIIGGAASGTVLVANPIHILKKIASGVAGVFGKPKFPQQVYLEYLKPSTTCSIKPEERGWSHWNRISRTPKRAPSYQR